MTTAKEMPLMIDKDPSLIEEQSVSTKARHRFTKRQWTIVSLISVGLLVSEMTYSLQGPFFTKEAEAKGVSPGVTGFIFGVYELVNFVVNPILGSCITKIGSRYMLNAGYFVTAGFCILFGFLDLTPSGTPFVALAFFLRIFESLGQSALTTAAYTIAAYEFPDNVGTSISVLETIIGVAVVLGPVVGGALYDAGGFHLPFSVVGGLLFITAILSTLLLPQIVDSKESSPSFFRLLRIPTIWISLYVCVTVSFSYNFFYPTLEPYLRQFDLSTSVVGAVFVINAGVYALTAVVWGHLADKYVKPKLLCIIGGVLLMASFLLVGPAVFIPLDPSLWLIIVALVLNGLGMGAQYVAGFLDCTQSVLKNGFPNTTETYGLIAGVWTSGICLGSFLGASSGGFLYDAIGFQNACLVNLGLHFVVVLFNSIYLVYKSRRVSWEPIPLATKEPRSDTSLV